MTTWRKHTLTHSLADTALFKLLLYSEGLVLLKPAGSGHILWVWIQKAMCDWIERDFVKRSREQRQTVRAALCVYTRDKP